LNNEGISAWLETPTFKFDEDARPVPRCELCKNIPKDRDTPYIIEFSTTNRIFGWTPDRHLIQETDKNCQGVLTNSVKF
jgi:hypothetical protein